jgi:hypothetical protein
MTHPHLGLYAMVAAALAIYFVIFKPLAPRPKRWKHYLSRIGLVVFVFLLGSTLFILYVIQGIFSSFPAPQIHQINIIDILQLILPKLHYQPGLSLFELAFYGWLNYFRYVFLALIVVGIWAARRLKVDSKLIIMIISLIFEVHANYLAYPIIGLALYSILVKRSTFGIFGRLSKHKERTKQNSKFKKSVDKERPFEILWVYFVCFIISTSFIVALYGGLPRSYSIHPYGVYPQYVSDYDMLAMNFIRQDMGVISLPAEFVIMGDLDTASAGVIEFGNLRLIQNDTRFYFVSTYLEPQLHLLWGALLWTQRAWPLVNVTELTGAKTVYVVLS